MNYETIRKAKRIALLNELVIEIMSNNKLASMVAMAWLAKHKMYAIPISEWDKHFRSVIDS